MPDEELILQGELIYYAKSLSPKFKEVLIAPISDVHYGNPLFSKRHFLDTVNFIASKPNVYTFLNGDLCEAALRTSKGEIFNQVGSPQDQRDWIIKQLKPIQKKILGMTIGNHEMRIWNDVGIDICKDIANALSVSYRAPGMLLKISWGDNNKYTAGKPFVHWLYFTHGYGGARTKAAKAVKVERTATWLHADVYLMSHDHVVNVAPDIYLLPDPRTHIEKDSEGVETGFTVGRMQAHRKMLVKTNSYLKWGGYAEIGGFPPSDLACPIVKLLSKKGKPLVKVEV